MKLYVKYIIVGILFVKSLSGNAETIIIDSVFSSKDIYNTLINPLESDFKNIEFNLYLQNSTATTQQLYFSVINPTIDKIVIYNNGDSVVLGDGKPFTKRTFKHANHVYPLLIKKNSTHPIRILVYNTTQHRFNFRLNLATENNFIKKTNHDYFFNGLFYGLLFMYLLLLICFYIFSKNNFFIIYLMINVFMLLLFVLYNGTGNQFFWFYSSGIQKYISMISVIGYLTMHIFFIRSFFSVQFFNFTKYFIRILLLVVSIFSIFITVQVYNRSIGNVPVLNYSLLINGVFLFYGLMVIILCIYSYIESKSREVIWVLIGMLFHIANWIIFINNEFVSIRWLNYIDNLKFFPSNIFVPQLNYYISMLEFIVVTVFISVNYHKLIRQNNLSTRRLEFLQKHNINTFVLGQEAEREIITKDIYNGISGNIEQLKTTLSSLQLMEDEKKIIPSVLNEIDKTLTDIKNITGNYVAPDMQQMELSTLIITATDKLFNEINTQYDFTKTPENFRLNEVASINLYRIFQEISNNTLKHSNAKNVIISAIKDSKSLLLKISDDGVGFSGLNEKNKGIGLMNIESRINSLNGNFYLLSNEKNGSTIHLIMPLKEITD